MSGNTMQRTGTNRLRQLILAVCGLAGVLVMGGSAQARKTASASTKSS